MDYQKSGVGCGHTWAVKLGKQAFARVIRDHPKDIRGSLQYSCPKAASVPSHLERGLPEPQAFERMARFCSALRSLKGTPSIAP